MRLPQTDNAEINQYIQQFYGCSLDDLLAPIGEGQVGESVRHNGVYFKIKEARRSDDPTLPQGIWTHELKVADWEGVEQTALNALCHKSKDLQLGVWLMESSIHRYGFAGVAPAAVLIRSLCETYWETMYPQMEDGDIEFRTNPINWINEKLALPLRLIPLSQADIDDVEVCWNDWDSAQRHEQLKRQQPDNLRLDGPSSESFKQHMAATPVAFFQRQHECLQDGLQAIDDLSHWLDSVCGDDSPSLAEISQLLNQILTMITGELKRRGASLSAAADNDQTEADSPADGEQHTSGGGGGAGGDGSIRNRADAFACLHRAAEFLMQDDPHSPVPYLIYTACHWGEQSAPDLYQELFLNRGGQLNIFELMGLTVEAG